MRQPAKGHSKFGDQLQNMHINQVCSDIDHLAAGPEKQNTLKKKKKKENKFAICEATTWCVRSVVCCAVVWGGSFNPKACVVHFRDMYSLGSISRARPGQISIRFISKCLITCRLSLNKHTSPSLSLFLSPFAVSLCSKCV